ncbi:hypothetical protein PoB_004827900 [Plakobranchus ocellatus]|uniref:Uncharacterized protein n=1 Tax=Plakobranchus ocellatus TaxID=259542 RepID=A0AAV4BSH7_9GAST|nr:hypothetical protein PoB_004827900 [Plakobranchus ocellatus]
MPSHIESKTTYDTNCSNKEQRATGNRNAAQTEQNLKKQMTAEPVEGQTGLPALWPGLKARYSALSRAESATKRRNQKMKVAKENFLKTRSSSPGSQFSNQDQSYHGHFDMYHKMIQQALKIYNIPEDILVMFRDLFNGFKEMMF